jgi:serine/threonine protein kinase
MSDEDNSLLEAYNYADAILHDWEKSSVPKVSPIKINWFTDTDRLTDDDLKDEEASETESIKDEKEDPEEEEDDKNSEPQEEPEDIEEFYMWPEQADSIVFRLSDEVTVSKYLMNKMERKVYFGHRKSDNLPVAVVVGEDHERHLQKNGVPREVRIMLRLKGQENVAELLGWAPIKKRHFVLIIRHYQSADMIRASIGNMHLISKITKSTLQALKQVHDCKVAHRDVAKYNLLWNPVDEKMMIIDFDNACFFRPEGYFKNVGREKYDAPEKTEMLEMREELKRKKSKTKRRMKGYTEKAEVYSVGVLLWMLVNQNEHSPSRRDLKKWVTETKRRNNHKKYPEIDLLVKMVNTDPDRRISVEDALTHPFITETPPNSEYKHMREYLLKTMTGTQEKVEDESHSDDDDSSEESSESLENSDKDSDHSSDESDDEEKKTQEPDVPEIKG